jgi:hypothetical protein
MSPLIVRQILPRVFLAGSVSTGNGALAITVKLTKDEKHAAFQRASKFWSNLAIDTSACI